MSEADLWQRRAEALLPVVEAAVALVHGGMRPYTMQAASGGYVVNTTLAERLRAAVEALERAARAEAQP